MLETAIVGSWRGCVRMLRVERGKGDACVFQGGGWGEGEGAGGG